MAEGVGVNLPFRLFVGNQVFTSAAMRARFPAATVTFSYAPPAITALSAVSTGVDPLNQTSSLPTDGGGTLHIFGTNFGVAASPLGPNFTATPYTITWGP